MAKGKLAAYFGRKYILFRPLNAVKMYRMADTYLPMGTLCVRADGQWVCSSPLKC